MKCESCKFLECCDTENGSENSCAIFGEDIPDILCNKEDDGCNLTYKEAEKLYKLEEDMAGASYSHMGLWFSLDGKQPTKEQKEELERVDKEIKETAAKYNNYYSIVENRRKKCK